jgi:signal transduction histidine kinase
MIHKFIDKYLLFPTLKEDSALRLRSHMLIWVLAIWMFVGFIAALTMPVTADQLEFPLIWVILVGFASLIIFRRTGNFDITSNLLAFGLALINIPLIRSSGGLYSDSLLWLAFSPMVVTLFGEKRTDIIWYVLLLVYFGYEYRLAVRLEADHVKIITDLTPDYYLLSYILFVSCVMAVVWMFKRGNNTIFANLIRHQQRLEAKHTELLVSNKRLNDTTGALTRSNKDLEAFASIASHDLKEPLRMIGMYSQLLKKRLGNDLTAEQEEFMQYILEGTSHMQKLLDDILDYSRVGRSNERIRLIDLDDVIYYVQRMMMASISEAQANIIVEGQLPEVFGRYSEMVQVMQNLLSNAIKFRKTHVAPLITISYQKEAEFHRITVSDNGIGLEQRYAEKVFQMFERLHTKTEYAGTGIGLALCNKIVSQAGGQIWLESELGVGTKIHMRFPINSMLKQEHFQDS